jgi:hypothetical protein
MSDQRAIRLQQLANIIIDAYLNRDNRFVPDFGTSRGKWFLSRKEGDHPQLQVDYPYRKSDYETEER